MLNESPFDPSAPTIAADIKDVLDFRMLVFGSHSVYWNAVRCIAQFLGPDPAPGKDREVFEHLVQHILLDDEMWRHSHSEMVRLACLDIAEARARMF